MKSASNEQLKAIDVWAFALTTFMIINPDQDYPYQMNIELLKKESDEIERTMPIQFSVSNMKLYRQRNIHTLGRWF